MSGGTYKYKIWCWICNNFFNWSNIAEAEGNGCTPTTCTHFLRYRGTCKKAKVWHFMVINSGTQKGFHAQAQ